ncbi:hypothetical protein [Phenylobacterium aquaticum]|uniref:hypothetical protein n=1 Tax=Phenylobacterium aquaticum TaxID=1763816 RepID=UPI0026F31912|nr:hypothetical protein [Phenylobacterium aquaticum]
MAHARNPRGRKASTATQAGLAQRIRETLLLFGGEAHRKEVIAQLARERGLDVRHIPPDLEREVIVSFESACRDETLRTALGFHLKFGEGSHRWAVRAPA